MEVFTLIDLFAPRFKELIKESNIKYEVLAKDLGFDSKGTIAKYANGQFKDVGVSLVLKIANYFGVSPVWLIGLTDNKHYEIKK